MISYYRGSTGREIKIWKGLFLSKRLSADLVSNVVGKRFIGTMTQTWLFSETKRRASCLGISGHARTETIRNSATCATRPTACKVSRRGARISPSVRPFPNVGAAAPSHYMGERLNGMIGLSLNDRTILPCALTGNGKKLSSSQAQLAYFLSISCEPSILSALYSIPSDLGIRKSR